MILPENESEISRIAIYVVFDKDGIIDDYVPYFLKGIKPYTTHLLVVVNGYVNYEGYKKIEETSDEILVRENKGYDITGYREGLAHIGWDKLSEYDECMLINSSLFGPIYPFSEMFEKMNSQDLDFWGVTKFHKCEYTFRGCKYNYTPEHIQSSFLVIRKSMTTNKLYQQVWDEMPEIEDYETAIGIFELPFTKESIEKGFKAGVYIDTTDLEGVTRYPLMMLADELIINRRCPIMKQKSFSQWYFDILDESIGYATYDAFQYIDKHTDYDVNMIWDNILRVNNMADIKNHMKLNYTLPAHFQIGEVDPSYKVALVMHIYYRDQIDDMMRYAYNMPRNADIIVITSKTENMDYIESLHDTMPNNLIVVPAENRGRDVSALLVAAYPYLHDYDLVCFVHDKKSNYIKPYNNGRSFFYHCMENLLGTDCYVNNIISLFGREPRLGMLMPPVPCHGDYYQCISSDWAGDYQGTVELAKKLGYHVRIDPDRPPITPLGTMFWFRPKAMKILFDKRWKYVDFPPEPNGTDNTILHYIERLYGFTSQNEGYYSGWCMTDDFSGMYIQNYYFMLRELNLKMFRYFWPKHIFDMVNRFDTNVARSTGSKPTSTLGKRKSENIRKWLKKKLPSQLYFLLLNFKRLALGPHNRPYYWDE